MKFNSCIKNLLKLICVLQDNSVNIPCFESSCTKAFLGPTVAHTCYNTRVITLYNKFGELFTLDYNDNGTIKEISNFRVQSVNDDCCTLLLLDEVDGSFISTRQFVTVSINCICAVKCIQDVVVSNL